jgi:two-component system NtrC family sensor kinase
MIRMALSISLVAILPLVVMTLVNYHQYQEAIHRERIRPIARLAGNAKNALEYFITERQAALELVVLDTPFQELLDQNRLDRLLAHMKEAFGGFIDLGLIDQEGEQVAYTGPFHLKGKNYREQDWFHQTCQKGVYTSDVFRGYRNIPHFIIAVRFETEQDRFHVLRATIDTEKINRQILGFEPGPNSDAFLINRAGLLQTPSRFYGAALERFPLEVPAYSSRAEVIEASGPGGEELIIGYAYIEQTPFVVMEVSRPAGTHESWLSLRRDLLVFLFLSIVVILAVTIWGSRTLVNRIREADIRRATVFHKMEYTNKMAAIGRLGAGVAHEINNPLAIINEKAGLLRDLVVMSEELPPRDKVIGLVDSVLKSVERCGDITRRLLGFAKHLEVQRDKIDLALLLREVLGFLEKEASYRGIQVTMDVPEDLPHLQSDRGQLQQVFLNIINNAFAAVADGGKIEISMNLADERTIEVHLTDNGMGIPQENLQHIFEPFFTTKKGVGTGLGLSITYGIVEKLGGKIRVQSLVGHGTTFSVILPIERDSF